MQATNIFPFSGLGGMVFLIGFMGSGKTHWGRQWAEELAMEFYDLDVLIEKQEGKTVAEIFEKKGEEYFRDREAEMIRSFANKEVAIISCGGGTPCFNDNMQWMNEHGTTVYLFASPKYIYDRVIEEKDHRPLLKNINTAELLFFIEQKLKEREYFYQRSKFILPVEELNLNSLESIITNS